MRAYVQPCGGSPNHVLLLEHNDTWELGLNYTREIELYICHGSTLVSICVCLHVQPLSSQPSAGLQNWSNIGISVDAAYGLGLAGYRLMITRLD